MFVLLLSASSAFAAVTMRACTAADQPPNAGVGLADPRTTTAEPEIRSVHGSGQAVKVPWSTSYTNFWIYNSPADSSDIVVTTDHTANLPRCIVFEESFAGELVGVVLLTSSKNDVVNLSAPTSGDPLTNIDLVGVFGGRGNDTIVQPYSPTGPFGVLVGGAGADTLTATSGTVCAVGPELASGSVFDWLQAAPADRDPYTLCVGTSPPSGYADKNDTITTSADVAISWGGDDVDTISASPGTVPDSEALVMGDYSSTSTGSGDTLTCTSRECFVEGGGGDDAITVECIGEIDIDGGGGVDTIVADMVNPTAPQDCTIYGGDSGDTISGPEGICTIYGEDGSDDITGGAAGDFLYGGNGIDVLLGAGGDDWLYGGDQEDYLDGGADDDVLYGDGGPDHLQDFDGHDFLIGGTEDDILDAEDGNDTLCGGSENDSYSATSGGNQLVHGLSQGFVPPLPDRLPADIDEEPIYADAGTGAGNMCTENMNFRQDLVGAVQAFGTSNGGSCAYAYDPRLFITDVARECTP